jgi:hypothetical protein
MTPFLAIARLFPTWVWTALAGLVACIIVGAVRYQAGRHDERVDQEAKAIAAELAARERDAFAKEKASAERLADALENDARQEELLDAVRDIPDARPTDAQRALACARLRQQGTRDADLPPGCRSGR